MHKIKIGQNEFTYRRADSPDLLEEVFRLRYQVYCKERNFLTKEDCPYGIERDSYDRYSSHFVAKNSAGVIGTARLVMDSPLGFPFEEHCRGNLILDTEDLPRHKYAEISRLVISKDYSRGAGSRLFYSLDMRGRMPITFGIYREMYRECKRTGINHWFAMMEGSLWKLLCTYGFVFRPIGKELDLYGPVRPYMANIAELERALSIKFPKFAEVFLEPEEECIKIK